MYSRYSFDEVEPGYPKEISKGFEGIPNDVDAAFVWSGNGKIYFFKVSIYSRCRLYQYNEDDFRFNFYFYLAFKHQKQKEVFN